MIGKVLNNKTLGWIIAFFILLGTCIVMFTPNHLFFMWGSNYAFQLLLIYLALGFFFLALGRSRLMFISFMCAGGLSLFLKYSSTPPLVVEKSNLTPFHVAHFNLSNSNEDIDETIEIIKSSDADIVSIQEVTPVWQDELKDCLSDEFPHSFIHPDIGIFGIAIFSKHEFSQIDTFNYKEISNILGQVKIDNKPINFVSAHTFPALNNYSYRRLKQHLLTLQKRINSLNNNVFALGDFHAVGWSKEIQEFRTNTELKDSRMGFTPTFPHGALTFLEVPVDFIFYPSSIECLDFLNISGAKTRHLGIKAKFQIKDSFGEPKENMQ